jgi:hypothetical protein
VRAFSFTKMNQEITPQHPEVGSLVPEQKGLDVKSEAQDQQRKLEVGEELHKFFLTLWEKCENLNKEDWLTVKRNMIKARKYFDGKQYGYVNDKCEWIDQPPQANVIRYASNAYQAHLQTALTEISKGVTELSFSHVSPDSRFGQLIAKIAEQRYKTHRKRLFDSLKYQQENLSLLLNGLALRYTYFAWQQTRDEKIPVFGKKDVAQGQSATVCAVCYSPREMKPQIQDNTEGSRDFVSQGGEDGQEMSVPMPEQSDADSCPNCGSSEVKEIQSPASQASVIQGYEGQQCGENKFATVDPLGVLFYLHAQTIKDSPYMIWKQIILKEVLQSQYPDTAIQEGLNSPELRYKYEHESSTPNLQARLMRDAQGGNDKDASEFEQGWFDTSLYANYKLKENATLRNGQTLPAGTKLGEAFPKGLYLAKNGKKILDVWSEDKNDKWTAVPYVTRIGTLIGAGTTIALEEQDLQNDIKNLAVASMFNDAFAKEFVNDQYLDPDSIPNSPSERGVVSNMPEGAKIVGTAIERMPPSQLTPEVYTMLEQSQQQMQMGMGTFAGNQNGAPDLKAAQDTAAGMMMWREMTVGRFAPMLAARADALDKEQAFQLLINDQKYLTPQQWEKLSGDYGKDGVKAFLSCDLREELCIEIVPESYMPTSRAVDRASIIAFGEFMVNTQMNPQSEMGAYAAKQFGVPQYLVGFDSAYGAAMASIDAFKEQADAIIQQFGDVPTFQLEDPTVMQLAQLVVTQSNIPVDPDLDDIEAIVNSLKDWWQKDAGRSASNLLKASVLYRNQECKAALVKREQENSQMQLMAQQPMIDQQQQMQAAQSQQEAQNGEAQNAQQAQMQGEQHNQAMEQQQAQADQQDSQMIGQGLMKSADMEEAEAQRQHDAQMQANEQEHQKEMARIQAKNKGSNSKS